jgi:hypothetical protein
LSERVNAYDSSSEELYFIKGDQPDPEGTGLQGQVAGMNLAASAFAHPLIRWDGPEGGRVIEADCHEAGGQLLIHLICPVCENGLHIRQGAKRIKLEGHGSRRRLSVSPFGCGHPIVEDGVPKGTCHWKVEIIDNVARDYRGPL